MTVWLTPDEHRTLAAVLDDLLPGDGACPGAGEMGGADYVDRLRDESEDGYRERVLGNGRDKVLHSLVEEARILEVAEA